VPQDRQSRRERTQIAVTLTATRNIADKGCRPILAVLL
jgi:hypothetical protein